MTYSFQAPRYMATGYVVEDLKLPSGAIWSGELSIEPDEWSSCEDWYIYRAHWNDPQDPAKLLWCDKDTNPDMFAALCKAVYSSAQLCMAISDEARI
jgi:hypothetical protein